MTDYYVGQKVVCIDNSNGFAMGDHCNLVKDQIYTILRISKFGTIGVLPDGLNWHRLRFRPLVETKSEVSFTIGADPDSEKWDNRKVKVKVK